MRARIPAAAAAAAVAVLVVAGCGSADGVRVGAPDPSESSTQPVCGDIVVTPGGGTGGREVCLSVGRTLRLELGAGDKGPSEQGDALAEVSPGVYRGARTGTAELSGFRRACPDSTPGVMSCHAVTGWKITVEVR